MQAVYFAFLQSHQRLDIVLLIILTEKPPRHIYVLFSINRRRKSDHFIDPKEILFISFRKS